MRRAALLFALVATSVVGFVQPAHAVGGAACVIGGTITFTEPFASMGPGTWEINQGQIDCDGALSGYRIFGSGPFTGHGTYTGILPDMFAEGREVVVEGRYESPGLKAKQIMTSCPSKYEAEREQGATHPGA